MIKKEIHLNFKSFIIWISIIIAMFIMVFAIYPSMTKDAELMNQLLSAFPKEMLEPFNMDVIGIGTVFGWIATEGFMMLTLVGGVYFAMMGSNILLKEENDGTIEFLYSKPITRNKIIISKLLTGFTYILLFNICISTVILLGLILSKDLNILQWFLISIIPIIIHLFFFSISFLVSIFLTKTRKSTGLSLGLLFGFYLLNVLGAMSEKIEFLKYLSPFYYINARSIITDSKIEGLNCIIVLIASIIFVGLAFKLFNKKELT